MRRVTYRIPLRIKSFYKLHPDIFFIQFQSFNLLRRVEEVIGLKQLIANII